MEKVEDYLTAHDFLSSNKELSSAVMGMEHFENCVNSLESLVNFFESTPNPSLEQLALTDLIMADVTRGTDLTPNDVVPSLESYVGTQVSTESIKDTIVKYYNQLVEFMKRIYESFKAFLKNFFDKVEPLKEDVKLFIKALDVKTDTFIEDKVLVGPIIVKMAVDYQIPKGYQDLSKTLGVVRSISESLFGNHADIVLKLSAALNEASKDANSTSDEILVKCNEMVAGAVEVMEKMYTQTTPVEGYLKATLPMFGNKRLATTASIKPRHYHESSSQDNIAYAASLRKHTFALIDTSDSSVSLNPATNLSEKMGAYTIPAMSISEQKHLASNLLAILEAMSKFRNEYESKLNSLAKQSEASSRQFVKVLDGKAKFQTDGTTKITNVNAAKAVLGFHTTLAKWSVEPFASMMSYNVTMAKRMMAILYSCNRNLERKS